MMALLLLLQVLLLVLLMLVVVVLLLLPLQHKLEHIEKNLNESMVEQFS